MKKEEALLSVVVPSCSSRLSATGTVDPARRAFAAFGSNASFERRQCHRAVVEHETRDACETISFCGVENGVVVAKEEKLFKVSHMSAYIYNKVLGIVFHPFYHLGAVGACRHNKYFYHNWMFFFIKFTAAKVALFLSTIHIFSQQFSRR